MTKLKLIGLNTDKNSYIQHINPQIEAKWAVKENWINSKCECFSRTLYVCVRDESEGMNVLIGFASVRMHCMNLYPSPGCHMYSVIEFIKLLR